jgi:hypothetical protein
MNDDDVAATNDVITKARDAAIARGKDAWKTGRKWQQGETKSARDVSLQNHANEAAKCAQTSEGDKPLARDVGDRVKNAQDAMIARNKDAWRTTSRAAQRKADRRAGK